jgi:hypothetical protein
VETVPSQLATRTRSLDTLAAFSPATARNTYQYDHLRGRSGRTESIEGWFHRDPDQR